MARELVLECHLQSSPEEIRAWIMRPALFLHVTAPLVRFERTDAPSFPESWSEGECRASMKLFGIVPIGWQAIVIEFAGGEGDGLVLRDGGYGPMLRKWDHRIKVSPSGTGTLYTDHLLFDAGWLTPVTAFFVKRFFRHRQRRLKTLDWNGFAALKR